MYRRFGVFALLLLLSGCHDYEWDQPEYQYDGHFHQLETTGIVKDGEGIIRHQSGLFYIETDKQQLLLYPYNLPETYRQDGLLIVFSGKIKQKQNIREVEISPCELIKIKKYPVHL